MFCYRPIGGVRGTPTRYSNLTIVGFVGLLMLAVCSQVEVIGRQVYLKPQ
jgi:hypothetical protein